MAFNPENDSIPLLPLDSPLDSVRQRPTGASSRGTMQSPVSITQKRRRAALSILLLPLVMLTIIVVLVGSMMAWLYSSRRTTLEVVRGSLIVDEASRFCQIKGSLFATSVDSCETSLSPSLLGLTISGQLVHLTAYLADSYANIATEQIRGLDQRISHGTRGTACGIELARRYCLQKSLTLAHPSSVSPDGRTQVG